VRGFRTVLSCGAQNRFKHTVDIAQHIIVPEAKNQIAHRFQNFRPRCISITFTVLSAIDLDNKMSILAAEIDDELGKRHLPPKFQASQTAIPELKP